jgi:hypothetical protein
VEVFEEKLAPHDLHVGATQAMLHFLWVISAVIAPDEQGSVRSFLDLAGGAASAGKMIDWHRGLLIRDITRPGWRQGLNYEPIVRRALGAWVRVEQVPVVAANQRATAH